MPKYLGINVDLDSEVAPFGIGVGTSTSGSFTCDFCHTKYNEPLADKEDDSQGGDGFVRSFDFGPWRVGDCCFKKLEHVMDQFFPSLVAWQLARADALKQLAVYRTEIAVAGQALVEATDK